MSSQRDRQRIVQRFLKKEGFYHGAIDGIWGGKSEMALDAYILKHNPVPSGGVIAPPAPDYHSMVRAFGRPGCHALSIY